MDDQNKNLILATALSFLVILVWFVLFPPEETAPTADPVAATQPATAPAATATATQAQPEVAPVPEAPRLKIDTPKLSGSVSLLGGRIDDLSLKAYHATIDPKSDIVRLLTPVGEPHAYYALYGWTPGGTLDFADVPGATTEWQQVGGDTLAPGKPVTLEWANGKGLTFTRQLAVDDNYMFTVTDSVANTGTETATLQPYGVVARHGKPADLQSFYVLHEGVVGRTDGKLAEIKYKDVADLPQVAREGAQAEVTEGTADGWLGFTDKYWMTVLVPEQGKPYTAVVKYNAQSDIYQTETRMPVVTVAPGASTEVSSRLFAGAKEWETIRNYQNNDGIAGFIDSIDWGWFFFFTKPIFWLLHHLHGWIGNMGLAIIALTFVLKILVLPLAYKSYVSMARMKELQPEMEALKERAGEDKQKLQKEMMQLYKEKKVNPAAGCLPIFLQIPIFFSLYKVIFVTLELRQAPFFGWLNDLSAPDPSSLFNLFGLLPWAAPAHGTFLAMIFIGVLPILLGISMWLQQKLNPAPADPAQAMIFAWMPWVFMFMLGSFASGLVLYWITNNTITFIQQYLIMRSHGHKPDIFGNIKAGFSKKQPEPAKGKK
ncbi:MULTISPECIES: membrane protein insertase YidC [Gemmobacter]|jgi:YidC/Oxa1 family membrane protein insertase|uniref:Membrane protein insertase YidC n=2 Tax=Gemmobacter TaxID=204456 RepID=A0A2T6A2S5_9RHOB|nr:MULTISPECIES: membrane protein insertase YidC [Gemmobacter]OJY36984.1 MAG: membrane protein insertase YidC [Rhodobacterales bacterium 65-51]PTX38127.1 protein translocase subunit yidC [Gemmobacter caeni]TWI89767.1 protein translocase subunit yidC [Gemmobacter caeni]GHC38651.1 membrane protein insertase YidC [Gemmobacter nanjingensis]